MVSRPRSAAGPGGARDPDLPESAGWGPPIPSLIFLSGRLRPAAQVAAEAPSRTSGTPRRAGVGGPVIGLFLRVAFVSDPQAVVLHLTVRPFRGPSQQRPIVPTPSAAVAPLSEHAP